MAESGSGLNGQTCFTVRTLFLRPRDGVLGPAASSGMKADTLHHHHCLHHHHLLPSALPPQQPTMPQGSDRHQDHPPHHQHHQQQQLKLSSQQRVVYLRPSCPIEDYDGDPSAGGRVPLSRDLQEIKEPTLQRWSRSASVTSAGGRGGRSQSLGRDTSAPPSLQKNSIYNKTLSWLRNLRTVSTKNRSNLGPDDDDDGRDKRNTPSVAEDQRATGLVTSTNANISGYRRGGSSAPTSFLASQDKRHSCCVDGHSQEKPGQQQRHSFVATDYPPRGRVQGGSAPGDVNRGHHHHHNACHLSDHRHSVAGDVSFSQDHRPQLMISDCHCVSRGTTASSTSSSVAGSDPRLDRMVTNVPPEYWQGQDTCTAGGRASSMERSKDGEVGPGEGQRAAFTTLGSTVTRILRARLFGRAKSSISLHLDHPQDGSDPVVTGNASHSHRGGVGGGGAQVPARVSATSGSTSALNLSGDYSVSAVKLRPKKGQGDSKHVYVVTRDTKPWRPRSCATLPRDTKLGKTPLAPSVRLSCFASLFLSSCAYPPRLLLFCLSTCRCGDMDEGRVCRTTQSYLKLNALSFAL